MRRTKARVNGLEIFKEVNNNKEDFFENETVPTEHKTKITHINLTANGRYMTTASSECVIIWDIIPEVTMMLKVDITKDVFEDEDEENEGGSDVVSSPRSDLPPKPTLACLDNDCIQLYVYTG